MKVGGDNCTVTQNGDALEIEGTGYYPQACTGAMLGTVDMSQAGADSGEGGMPAALIVLIVVVVVALVGGGIFFFFSGAFPDAAGGCRRDVGFCGRRR